MTGKYDWNPMPHTVNIKCPGCEANAIFEFAEVVKIKLKGDVPFFQESPLFDYEILEDSCGHRWHAAIYYSGLHGGSVAAISNLPEGYEPCDWEHSEYLYRGQGLDMGAVTCSKCSLMRRHILNWPQEAYYSINYKGQQLWAFNTESAQELLNYISSSNREVGDYKWRNLLLHVPTIFKKYKAREHVVKKLGALLSN